MNENKNIIELIDKEYIKRFCEKWNLKEFSVFGSFANHQENEQSDIDILVDFKDKFKNSLFDFIEMKETLESYFHRKVDLLTLNGLLRSKNIVRTRDILDNRVKLYES